MQVHRAYILAALAFAAPVGTAMGFHMMLAWLGLATVEHYDLQLAVHAQLQVYGFVVLFTMGVALLMLPKVLGTAVKPVSLAYFCLGLMLAGLGANVLAAPRLGAALQSLSAIGFLAVLSITRRGASLARQRKSPVTREQAAFLASGGLWLVASPGLSLVDSTRGLESVLWGFAGLYVAGVGLRLHTAILGIKGTHTALLGPSVFLWNLGLCLRWLRSDAWWVGSLAMGVGLFLIALRPFRRAEMPPAGMPWLRYYVRTSYLWLIVSVVLLGLAEAGRPGLAPAARHALATGFLVTMIVGMGLRMILAFEGRRVIWEGGPWFVFVALTFGTGLRVGAQALGQLTPTAIGGGAQALAIWAFVLLMLTSRPIAMPSPTRPLES